MYFSLSYVFGLLDSQIDEFLVGKYSTCIIEFYNMNVGKISYH